MIEIDHWARINGCINGWYDRPVFDYNAFMTNLDTLAEQATFTIADLVAAARVRQPGSTERQQIDTLIDEIKALCANFFSPDTTLIRHNAFAQYVAADFAAWAEEDGDYASGKEQMDAEAAYIIWLRPLCAELLVAGVVFYLNHKLLQPEDWFFRRSAWQ